MFGIGISEIVLIAVVALLVVGPKRLPEALRATGRAIGEFRRTTNTIRKEVALDEVVEDVTRPLREGMAGIEADVKRMDDAPRRIAPSPSDGFEYPEGGADDYGALPENAKVYAQKSPYGDDPSAQKKGGYAPIDLNDLPPDLPPEKAAAIRAEQEQLAAVKAAKIAAAQRAKEEAIAAGVPQKPVLAPEPGPSVEGTSAQTTEANVAPATQASTQGAAPSESAQPPRRAAPAGTVARGSSQPDDGEE